jgi:hypothetical protein
MSSNAPEKCQAFVDMRQAIPKTFTAKMMGVSSKDGESQDISSQMSKQTYRCDFQQVSSLREKLIGKSPGPGRYRHGYFPWVSAELRSSRGPASG